MDVTPHDVVNVSHAERVERHFMVVGSVANVLACHDSVDNGLDCNSEVLWNTTERV